MAGFGACGFHTGAVGGGLSGVLRRSRAGRRRPGTGPPATFVAPLGPDPAAITAEAATAAVAGRRDELDRLVGDRKLIVRVDRVELSKNILRGFWAFEELLETRPEWRDAGGLPGPGLPLAGGLAEYLAYRTEVEHTVEPGSTRPGAPPTGPRSSSTWPTTGTARWPPFAATTSCW